MIGEKILHYKIIEKIGEGGMGVVYLAEDTKLDRKVAIKFLPDHITPDSDERQRFEIEAKAASALNHPNVCTIHDIQENDGRVFMVMEYVDGQLLREKISSQTFKLKNAIETGIQLAEGLAAAHEKGIVHRDIKPENIIVRKDGIVQILDFGLAKFRGISKLTKEGSTVGTAGYMSPEQIQGQESDHRSDIFSLGVVLYELLTGQLPFHGMHEAAITYEILNVDPELPSSIKPEIEPEIDRILMECLEKDSNERTQSIKQVAIDLRRALRESGRQRVSRISKTKPATHAGSGKTEEVEFQNDRNSQKTTKSFRWLSISIAVLVGLALGYGLTQVVYSDSSSLPVIRATVQMPPSVLYSDAMGGSSTISPDGNTIAFVGFDTLSQSGIWIRPVNSNESKLLPGTKDATYPFWSPFSDAIGFFADGKLKTVDIASGLVLALADAPFGRGGAWSKSGEIVFSPAVTEPNLYAVSVSGGERRQATSFDSTSNYAPRFPIFLPDDKHFLFSYMELRNSNPSSDIYVGSLDNHDSQLVLKDGAHGRFANGMLLYLRQRVLLAQPFDPSSFELKDQTIPLQSNINYWAPRSKADYSVSENGIILYAGTQAERSGELVWIDNNGIENSITPLQLYRRAAISPDGNRIAYDQFDTKIGEPITWIYNIVSKAKLRLTFMSDGGLSPCWSKDGKRVYYNVETDGSKSNIFVKNSDGSGKEELLARGQAGDPVLYLPWAVSPDGRFLLITISNESISELATIDLDDTKRPTPAVKLGIKGEEARFSPDGNWIVYRSDESGISEIYVAAFKGRAGKWQLSVNGGTNPIWLNKKIIYHFTNCSQFTISERLPRELASRG